MFYKELIEDAKMIRQKVFVEEQGFENEFDDIDQRSLHLVVYQDNEPIGCARMYPERENMTGVDIDDGKIVGDPFGDGAFARAGRSVNGNADHSGYLPYLYSFIIS